MLKPKTISGFYENLPENQLIENKFKDIIKLNYNLAWFTSLETSSIERIETLTSKWWDDNEIYAITRLKWEWEKPHLGLRFDLTVPLARYISQNEWKLTFPFKRQQIQKSWRWERPQKWRFREFYQADIDIISNTKLPILADIEIIYTIYKTLKSLDFWKFIININNKKLLVWFLDFIWVKKTIETITLIDKKDKIKDLEPLFLDLWLEKNQINKIFELIDISNKWDYDSIINYFSGIKNTLLINWLSELKEVYLTLLNLGIKEDYIKINPSISRGLNYYTWTVFETFIFWAEKYWSISSWWRYDNLTSNFSKNNFPWVWWSIWLTRLLSVLRELNKIKDNSKKTITDVLILNLWKDYLKETLILLKKFRENGINTEIFLNMEVKMWKQIKYADNKKIPYVVIFWEQEQKNNEIQFKILETWEQKTILISELNKLFKDLKNEK